ncbi:MAG: helix-turn-helix domain-containing protein [Actinomycetia bacterium]|nr:helix-turn-helix domain-containing protein [Actinomycetes bacterium]
MEVKLLPLEALQTGLTKAEVAEIIGVARVTVSNWQQKYDEEGLPGLSNLPVKPGPRPPQVRRFERALPSALWQIDIFTFEFKRMYEVYLIGNDVEHIDECPIVIHPYQIRHTTSFPVSLQIM